MTFDEVRSLVRQQVSESPAVTNDHRITLGQTITAPKMIPIIFRTVSDGHVSDVIFEVWLVGQEGTDDGYKIVMQKDGQRFGLASTGFPSDEHLVLDGWYGSSLLSAFLAM